MSELPATEDEALEELRVAIERYRSFQVREDPTGWDEGTVVDYVVISASQSISDTGELMYQTTVCTNARQARYRTLGLLALADELVDAMYSDDDE